MKKHSIVKSDTGMARAYIAIVPFLLFFLSGFSGLIYEVVWSRMLVLVLGNTTIANATILASFMAGLGAGGYYFGKYIENSPRSPLRLFGLLELLTGILAILVTFLIANSGPLDLWITHLDNEYLQLIARVLLCCLLLILPTFFMGGTLAVLGKAVIKHGSSLFEKKASLLYSVNTLGGLFGAFSGGFFLIGFMGHQGSIFLAAAINIVIGMVAILSSPYPKEAIDKKEERVNPTGKKKKVHSISPSKWGLLILAGVFVTGLCAIAYQILWTRLLILVIDNSVYSFTLILMIFLLGIGLGSLFNAFSDRLIKNRIFFFGLLVMLIAISSYFVPFNINYKPRAGDMSYLQFLIQAAPLFLLLPTFLMGVAFPVSAKAYQQFNGAVGRSLGYVYGANTIGAVFGAAMACVLLAAQLGLRNSLLTIGVIQLVIGAVIVCKGLRPALMTVWGALCCLTVYFAISGFPVDYIQDKYSQLKPESKLIYFDEALTTTAAIFQEPDGVRTLFLNGIPEVDNSRLSMKTFFLMGALPGILQEKSGKSLMVTFGAGITASMASNFSTQVDCVDLSDQATQIASFYARENNNVINQSKVKIFKDDARHFLKNSAGDYSIIVSDATHPRVYDSWVLFTSEFYELVNKKLADDGIFLQWLPFHGLTTEQYMRIVKTFHSQFQYASLWRVGDAYSLLMATPNSLTVDFQAAYQRMQTAGAAEYLRKAELSNLLTILSYFSMKDDDLAKMTADFGEVMTDNSPDQLFFPYRATFKEQYNDWPLQSYQAVRRYEKSIVPSLTNLSDSKSETEKIKEAINYYERTKNR